MALSTVKLGTIWFDPTLLQRFVPNLSWLKRGEVNKYFIYQNQSLLFTINDLLVRLGCRHSGVSDVFHFIFMFICFQDLTRLESGNETSFNEPFDLHMTIEDAVYIYQREASRRSIDFILDISESPRNVVGDSRKIRTVVQNLTANART